MTTSSLPGGTFALTPDITVTRMGFGAMQLAGKRVLGPPADRDGAIAVLHAVRDLGITHLDTADYYGPYLTNELIREALEPFPADLHIVTKVGAFRDARGNWPAALSRDDIRKGVHENLEHLGLDALDVVNLRVGGVTGPTPGPISEPFTALAELQREGLVRHLGVSNVTPEQFAEAQQIAPVVEVQNFYNIANRQDDAFIDDLAAKQIAYVPYFPLGGFSPIQSEVLKSVAQRLGLTTMGVALAWLLQRSPNILIIAGTSSEAHLRDNVAGAGFELPADALAELNTIAG